eukprot:9476009-Pyramimonas_sp.AAC.1
MPTGIDEPLSITSAGPVFSYEHKLAAAKTLRAHHFNRIDDRVPPDTMFEFQLVKCDATNQEAIQKAKVHVAVVHSA